jgi:ferredoxin-NADP reductase
MAPPKTARVVGAEWIASDTRLVHLDAAEPLGFVGGQYVIIDSGLVLDNGKAAKRAYSIVSADTEQTRFVLAVMRIAGGRCSSFMHEVRVGAEVKFSGPWGKLYPPERAGGRTLVLATDTGISAALGLVQSTRFAPLIAGAVLIWLRTSPDYFLPEPFVRALVPPGCDTRIAGIPPIGDPLRVPCARALFDGVVGQGGLAHGFIAGDGAVNYALLADLVAAGVPATKDHVESFFNMPKNPRGSAEGAQPRRVSEGASRSDGEPKASGAEGARPSEKSAAPTAEAS